jgi:hypothetical protein
MENLRLHENNSAPLQTNTSSSKLKHFLYKFYHRNAAYFRLIFLRLPSIIAADLILLNSDSITNYFFDSRDKFDNEIGLINSFMLFMMSKCTLFTILFICFVAFILNEKYLINVYKISSLISLPYLFTFLRDSINTSEYSWTIKLLPLLLVYSFISSLTVLVYENIYKSIIYDRHHVYESYLLNRNVDPDHINLIVNQEYESLFNNGEYHQISSDYERQFDNSRFKWLQINKRRIYILSYFTLSLFLNEFMQQEDGHHQEYFNIISLGYLGLFFYDLSTNLDQMLLRLIVKCKVLLRFLNQYGIIHFISYNWFDRLKIPFLLRIYFLFRTYLFTLNFLCYYEFYLSFNNKLSEQTLSDLDGSLFYSLKRIFWSSSNDELSGINNNNNTSLMYVSRNQEEYFIASNLHHLISLIPFYGRNFYTVSQQQPTSNFIKHNQIYIYIRMLVLNITSNIVSIAATTAILSFQFYLIGIFMQHLVGPSNNNHNHNNLNNNNHPNPPETDLGSVGDVAASLFFLLSIQSGLSSLHAKLKIEKFFKNYSLLFIAILHFFHTQFDSQLMMLSASTKLNWRNQRNIRVLSLSSMLILIPIVILYVLFRNCSPSTWMLAASAFNIELMVKMSVSLFLYAIFTIDSMRTISSYKNKKKTDESDLKIEEENNQFSEHLDDYVYYVKAFGHIIEFLIGLVLFFNGAYILLFESYGAIRAIMMCIHAYYHIWLQARKGWSVFIKRRTAIKKLKCLEVFRRELFESEEEYERKKRDDVCAICFCELGAHESRITNCNHIFHFICLRKWLYLQDTCPMCHQKVYEPPKPQVNGQMQQPNQEQQDQN